MYKYIIRRLLQVIPVLIIATFAIFMLIHLVPGDPAMMLAGLDATPDQIQAIRTRMGLDQPLPVQYFSWIGNLFRGNMGNSMISGMAVSYLIGNALPATIELTLSVLIFALLISIPLGILLALKNKSKIDHIVTSYLGISLALPNFWVGILLILVFSVGLRIFPSSGRVAFFSDPLKALYYLILPVFALGNRLIAEITRFVKNSVLDTMKEDYVRTARTKGLTQFRIVFKHVLRNALVPIVTMLGMRIGRLLGGAVVVETVFAWPGMGRLIVQSIGNRDYPLVQGCLLVVVLIFILVNLSTDLLYGIIDPRISVANDME